MKGLWGSLALLFATLSAVPASAGTVYKCVDADGIPHYGNKQVDRAVCSVVGRDVTERPQVKRAVSPPAAVVHVPVPVERTDVVAPVIAAPTASLAPRRQGQRQVSGQLYTYMNNGVRHYTSTRPPRAKGIEGLRAIRYSFIETCYACAARPGVDFGHLRLDTASYQTEIAAAAREFGVEEAVVRAIIHAESAYNPMALSRAGAQGLMQLMPGTARRFGVADAYDAAQNIRGGVHYLSWLLKRFDGNVALAAAGYNAGEGAVDRYGGVPPYAETQRYVQRVGVLADRYRDLLALQ